MNTETAHQRPAAIADRRQQIQDDDYAFPYHYARTTALTTATGFK